MPCLIFFNFFTWCSWFLLLFISRWLIWIACLVPWSRLFSQGVWVLGCFVLTQLWLLQLTGYCNYCVLKHLRCPGFQLCGFLPHCLADTPAHLGSQGQWSLSAWPLHFLPNSMEWKNPKWQEIRCCDCCSIVRSYPTLCDPMGCSTPGLPCPSLSPRVCSDLHWLSWWCYPNISSSDAPFSFCPQCFPASGSFPMSQQEVGWWAWVWPLAETPYIPPLHSPSHTYACEHTLTHTHRLWDEDF